MEPAFAFAWTQFTDWCGALSPEFAFLLALPFVLSAVSFAAEFVRRARARPDPARQKEFACHCLGAESR